MSRPLSSEYSVKLGFSMNLRLGKNLTILRNAVLYQDFDCCGIIDGGEGLGKSVLSQQVGCLLDIDNKISIDQVVFTADEFKKAVLSLKPGKVIIWDEARAGLNRRRSMDKVNIDITDMLAEVRQKNLFMILVMPTFHDMDLNAAIWRTRFLIHVMGDLKGEDPKMPLRRGFFRFYNEEGKKMLYVNKYHRQSYAYPFLNGCCFEATFPHHYCVDEGLYRKKKREALRAYGNKNRRSSCPQCSSVDLRYRSRTKDYRCKSCSWNGIIEREASRVNS